MLVFQEREKPEYPEKNVSVQSREPTNSTHIWRRVWESNPGHIGGRRVLSPLVLNNALTSCIKWVYKNEMITEVRLQSWRNRVDPSSDRRANRQSVSIVPGDFSTYRAKVEVHWRRFCRLFLERPISNLFYQEAIGWFNVTNKTQLIQCPTSFPKL